MYEKESASLVFDNLTFMFREAKGLGAGFRAAEDSESPADDSCCGRDFGIACEE